MSRSSADDTKITEALLDMLAYVAWPNRRVRKVHAQPDALNFNGGQHAHAIKLHLVRPATLVGRQRAGHGEDRR